MILEANARDNSKITSDDDRPSGLETRKEEPDQTTETNGGIKRYRGWHESITAAREGLPANRIAQAVGRIQINIDSHRSVLDRFPEQTFKPNRITPCNQLLCVIERGRLQIKRARDRNWRVAKQRLRYVHAPGNHNPKQAGTGGNQATSLKSARSRKPGQRGEAWLRLLREESASSPRRFTHFYSIESQQSRGALWITG